MLRSGWSRRCLCCRRPTSPKRKDERTITRAVAWCWSSSRVGCSLINPHKAHHVVARTITSQVYISLSVLVSLREIDCVFSTLLSTDFQLGERLMERLGSIQSWTTTTATKKPNILLYKELYIQLNLASSRMGMTLCIYYAYPARILGISALLGDCAKLSM